jgi:hypothetical protein
MKKPNQKLVELYNKLGLFETSKMLGIKSYDLMKLIKIPFGPDEANTILVDMFHDGLLPEKYKGFDIYCDMNGIVNWTTSPNDLIDILVLATPFWDGSDQIPVDITIISWFNGKRDQSYEDEYNEVIKPSNTEFKNMEDLLMWFRDFYLPETYNLIKSTIKL